MKYKVNFNTDEHGVYSSEYVIADGFRYEEGCLLFWKGEENDFVKLYSLFNLVSVELVDV